MANNNTYGAMTFNGLYVKTHRKDRNTGLIKVIFFDYPPILVPYAEWKAKQKMVGHSRDVPRHQATRNLVTC